MYIINIIIDIDDIHFGLFIKIIIDFLHLGHHKDNLYKSLK